MAFHSIFRYFIILFAMWCVAPFWAITIFAFAGHDTIWNWPIWPSHIKVMRRKIVATHPSRRRRFTITIIPYAWMKSVEKTVFWLSLGCKLLRHPKRAFLAYFSLVFQSGQLVPEKVWPNWIVQFIYIVQIHKFVSHTRNSDHQRIELWH